MCSIAMDYLAISAIAGVIGWAIGLRYGTQDGFHKGYDHTMDTMRMLGGEDDRWDAWE